MHENCILVLLVNIHIPSVMQVFYIIIIIMNYGNWFILGIGLEFHKNPNRTLIKKTTLESCLEFETFTSSL